jgi:hypothetical protein
MHACGMVGWKNCRFARMSSGRYCLIRDLGLVKGGKGLRHHEVLIAFSFRAALQRLRQLAGSLRRFNAVPQFPAREILGKLVSPDERLKAVRRDQSAG